MKRWMTLFAACLLTVSVAGCSATQQDAKATDGKLKVSVTFNAMKEFVEAVGKDKVEITTIIPDGTEPHDFELKGQDMVALRTAKLVVYNGLGMEGWIDEAIKAANNPSLIAVDTSKEAEAIKNTEEEEIAEHGQFDPHLWLSLKGAQIQMKNIRDALIQADPANKSDYEKNYTDAAAQYEALYQEYKTKFTSLENKSFVTGHAAFAYLCRDFGLEQNSVEGVFAEGEPTAKQLAELVEYCKTNHVKTIFAEEMASPSVSQTLANEVGAKVETIYTVEGKEDGKTYLQRMTGNLGKIYESLK